MNPRPYEIQSELVGWPLFDKVALTDAVLNLRDPSWRHDTFPPLQTRLAGLGFHNHLVRLVNHLWGFPNQGSLGILPFLQQIAHQHLRRDGDRVILRDAHTSDSILCWRHLSFVLPPSILCSALDHEAANPVQQVTILHPSHIPNTPVAHLHQHSNACAAFELIWAYLTRSADEHAIRKRGTPAGFDPTEWVLLLMAALSARRYLGSEWFGVHFQHDDQDWKALLLAPNTWHDYHQYDAAFWAKSAMRHPDLTPLPKHIRAVDVYRADPLYRERDWPEGEFIAEGFRRFANNNQLTPEELLDYTLFVQILRIKSHLYRHLLVDTRFNGLSTFVEVFERMKTYRGELESLAVELGAPPSQLDLRSIEVRTAPSTSYSELLDLVSTRGDGPPANGSREWSWTLHFIRSLHTYNRLRKNPHQHAADWLRITLMENEKRVNTVLGLLRTYPELLHVFRGLDICTDELEGPTWSVAPAIYKLRTQSEILSAQSGIGRPMRVTIHAGEDFANPVSGLRHIAELLDWKLLRRNDRVGHAVALGIAPAAFVGEQVPQPRWERFLDLCWLLTEVEASPQEWTHELHELAHTLGLGAHSTTALICIHRQIGEVDALDHIMNVESPSDTRLHDFLYAIREETAHQIICHRLDNNTCTALSRLQQRVANRLAERDISVEMNPSSNMMIGGLKHPLAQPLFQQLEHLGLRVSLSADDPLLLSTNLDDEFAYAYAGLLRAGRTPHEAQQWLDNAARTSMDTRFSGPISCDMTDIPTPFARTWKTCS